MFAFVISGTHFVYAKEIIPTSSNICLNTTLFQKINKFVSFGFKSATSRSIDTIVLHSSHAIGKNPYDINSVISLYKHYKVSPHYVIGRDGAVYKLVSEKNTAWHAGQSTMPDGRTNANSFSIGIEIIGLETESPSKEQYASLVKLVHDIESRYIIKHIVGHSDIAPERKTDPWGFDWNAFKTSLECPRAVK